jgi:hypothetical protein
MGLFTTDRNFCIILESAIVAEIETTLFLNYPQRSDIVLKFPLFQTGRSVSISLDG